MEASAEGLNGVEFSPKGHVVSPRTVSDMVSLKDSAGGEAGPMKDYVREWLGNEIKKERPQSDFAGTSSNVGKTEKKKLRRRLEWWVSMDDEKKSKKEKRRPAREWWKEEYCEELAREKKKKRKQLKGYMSDDHYNDNWRPRDEMNGDRRKRSGSRGSMDWWLEGDESRFLSYPKGVVMFKWGLN